MSEIIAGIEVVKAGIYSSIQDLGRFGFRDNGVPTSGAMDSQSAKLANLLVNNDINAAVLEMAYLGCELKFQVDTFIGITGARCEVYVNDESVSHNQVIAISAGDLLKFKPCKNNVYVYLAVAGGFQSLKILNSRSFYYPITAKACLQAGDKLAIKSQQKAILNRSKISPKLAYLKNNKIKVSRCFEFAELDKKMQQQLLQQKFKISVQSNRMAYKLEYPTNKFKFTAKEIITSSVQAGTVQLTPAGEIIVLMRDAQTTGGYSRILQLDENALNQLAQMPAASRIFFEKLTY